MARATDLTLQQQVRLLSGADYWNTESVPEAGVPAVLVSDGPHGLRVQRGDGDHLGLNSSQPATCFPPAVTMASTWDDDLVRQVGAAVADEARALGVGVVLGPGLNIKRHPLGGRSFEYFSEDPLVSGRMAAALVEGLQSRGIGACVKHFAVNNHESHRFVVDAVVDERTLREMYLAGFEHVVTRARPWAVMAAYNSVNGTTCTANRRLLTDVLRDEWGFDGIVMSDWGATGERAACVDAGMDLEMPSSEGISDGAVQRSVERGALSAEAVATSAQRVLDLAERAPTEPSGDVDELVEPHDALARRVAAEGTVLLTNDGTLPLRPGTRVALVGAFAEHPRYQGSGSSLVTPTRLTTARDAFGAQGVDVTYAPGYDPQTGSSTPAQITEAAQVAAEADVVVVLVGLPGRAESEGFDREHLRLPSDHDALVAACCEANPRTVVALSNGAPVVLPWASRAAAVLECYLGGQASGGALVDVLYGAVEPGGRLAESFPARQEELAADPYFPGEPHQVEHREGLFVGYRHLVSAGVPAAFPFGHGLGYTRHDWSEASVDRSRVTAGEPVRVSLTVTSTGDRPSSDVVQVYGHDRTGVVLRPRRELVGYAKVRLEPGESRRVEVDVPARAMAFYDTRIGDWLVPDGEIDLEVGRSSEDVVATLTVTVDGGATDAPQPADEAPVAADDAHFARRLGRPVPTPRPVRPFTRESTVEEVAQTWLGRRLRDVVRKQAAAGDDTDEATRLMFERSVEELPLRAVAGFAQGRLRWSQLDAVVDLMNRRPHRPLVRAVQRRRSAR